MHVHEKVITEVTEEMSLAVVATLALQVVCAAPKWKWDTVQSFVHCSNRSGPLNEEIVQVCVHATWLFTAV